MTESTAGEMFAHTGAERDHDRQRAFRRIRYLFLFMIIGTLLAMAWDGWYHTQVPFDGFFSPPHVFAYTIALIGAALVNDTVLNRRLRRWFGPGFRMPVLKFPVPGALVLLGGGFVLLGFAGLVLDNFWHSNFGLDETGWSAPHAMIGWALIAIILGFAACRLALGKLTLGWTIALSVLFIWLITAAATGPIGTNNTIEVVRARAALPVIASQPDAMRAIEITEYYNLTRSNPWLLVFAPFGAAIGLAFARSLDSRVWLVLLIALLVSGSGERNSVEFLSRTTPGLMENEANYAGLPVIVLMLGFYLCRLIRLPPRAAWAVGGVLFALTLHAANDMPDPVWWLALIGGITAIIGAWLGDRTGHFVRTPHTPQAVFGFAAIAIGVPFLVGAVDMYWRLNFPG
jgi:hypothetical protein